VEKCLHQRLLFQDGYFVVCEDGDNAFGIWEEDVTLTAFANGRMKSDCNNINKSYLYSSSKPTLYLQSDTVILVNLRRGGR
jgi:hypothetical protein